MPSEQSQEVASTRSGLQTLRGNIGPTARLAGPVVVARSGALVLVAVDTAMTGRVSVVELAYFGLGIAPQVVLLVISIGLLVGTAVLTAQADGAGEQGACGAIWRISLVHAVVLGVVTGLLCLAGEPFLLALGQEPDLARGAGEVLTMFSWSMPGMLVGITTGFFLEGISRPKPNMIVMLGANVVNAGLNWVLIYGNLGAPAMGAEGAALATAIVRCLIAAALIAYVLSMKDGARYGVRGALDGVRETGRKLRRIGYPLGFAYGLETGAMATLVVFAGYLGARHLASYQIAQNLIALCFMVALGIATATSIRVANAVGRQDPRGLMLAGWTGIGMVAISMTGLALVFLTVPELLAAIYTNEAEIVWLAAATIWIVGFALLFDGVQAVALGALRGTADVWVPASLHLIAFWGVAVPAAAWFAFEAEMGAPGLALGLLCGLVVDATVLSLRFAHITKRDSRRL